MVKIIQTIKGELSIYDANIGAIVSSLRSVPLNNIILFVTYIGEWQTVLLGVVAASIILALLKRWYYIAALLVSVVGGEFFVLLAKHIIGRPRPDSFNALIEESGFSFPSGHSFLAVSFYGLLAYFLFRFAKTNFIKGLIIITGTVIIFSIGFSRVYLGVHWLSDVLASFVAGGIWLIIIITALEHRRKFRPYESKPYLSNNNIYLASGFLMLLWFIYLIYIFKANPLGPILA